jgi:hypothetical protein
MIRASASCWRRIERLLAILTLLLAVAWPAAAQSSACNRAQAIVEEIKRLAAATQPEHRTILEKLRTAQQLCPTNGEIWKYAYCSALAIGDQQSARLFKDRAIFNNADNLTCAGGVSVPVPLPAFVRQKYALVVGIGKFRDEAIPRLQYAAKDATDFAAVLTDPQYGHFAASNVTVLIDEKATRAAILNAVQQLFLKAQENDLVVIYISSHGSPSQQDKGLGGVGYIVTYDTAVKNIWVDAIEYQDFAAKTALIRARRKVAFLDTCFSGQASRHGEKALAIEGGAIDDRTAKMFLSGEGTFVITSSNPTERSWESDTIHNSYFTHFLMAALKQSKEPPTVKAIFDYVSSRVADIVAREKQAPQHPQMHPEADPGNVRIGVIPREGESDL